MRMTMITKKPHIAYVMNAPGPVLTMTTPEPTNSSAPMPPPIAIILSCRSLSPFFSVVALTGLPPLTWTVGFRGSSVAIPFVDHDRRTGRKAGIRPVGTGAGTHAAVDVSGGASAPGRVDYP